MCFLPFIKPSQIYIYGFFYYLVSGFKGDVSTPQPGGGITPTSAIQGPTEMCSDSQAVHLCDAVGLATSEGLPPVSGHLMSKSLSAAAWHLITFM